MKRQSGPRIGEQLGIEPRLDPNPMKGNGDGARAHSIVSTTSMRDERTGPQAIQMAVTRLAMAHDEHTAGYGHGLANRLTGRHETCSISEFRSGVADRAASIRIPRSVMRCGYGYLEDRRVPTSHDGGHRPVVSADVHLWPDDHGSSKK